VGIIEVYKTAEGIQPRTCQRADLTPGSMRPKCTAEVIVHGTGREEFLCRIHAAQALSGNRDLLATAVIELAIQNDILGLQPHRHHYNAGDTSGAIPE
jgi:hypothetical protein